MERETYIEYEYAVIINKKKTSLTPMVTHQSKFLNNAPSSEAAFPNAHR